MSRPRVIKDNNGVAVVEGTPAASLVKDIDKFFATKPRERMAGENIAQKRTLDPRAINTRRPTPKDLEQMNNPPSMEPAPVLETLSEGSKFAEPAIRSGRRPSFENLSAEEQAEVTAMREKQMEERRLRSEEPRKIRRPVSGTVVKKPERMVTPVKGRPNVQSNRNKAKEKAESRRERFFQRRRSAKEAERSQTEQEATQGKFITTLGR